MEVACGMCSQGAVLHADVRDVASCAGIADDATAAKSDDGFVQVSLSPNRYVRALLHRYSCTGTLALYLAMLSTPSYPT